MSGTIVEQHEDRIVLATKDGNVPLMREKIESIFYDAPEWRFLQAGEAHEQAGRWSAALESYQNALRLKPDFAEAQKAVVRVKNKFWSRSAGGPDGVIEKKQSLFDSWDNGKPPQTKLKNIPEDPTAVLENRTGIVLETLSEWTWVEKPGKEAAAAGLQKNDRLVELDGRSLRYLNKETVVQKFLLPRFSNFILEFEREFSLPKTGFEKDLAEFGLQVKKETGPFRVSGVLPESFAQKSGLLENDRLISVGGLPTDDLSVPELLDAILRADGTAVPVVVRRQVTLSRK